MSKARENEEGMDLVCSRLLVRVNETRKRRQQHHVTRHALNRHDEERIQCLALALLVDLDKIDGRDSSREN